MLSSRNDSDEIIEKLKHLLDFWEEQKKGSDEVPNGIVRTCAGDNDGRFE